MSDFNILLIFIHSKPLRVECVGVGEPFLLQRMVGVSLPLAEHWMEICLFNSRH